MLKSHKELWYSIPVCLFSPSVPLSELARLGNLVQMYGKGPQDLFKFDVHAEKDCTKFPSALAVSMEAGDGYSFAFSPESGSVKARYSSSDLEGLPSRIAESLQSAYLEEHASIAYLMAMNGRNSDAIQDFVKTLPGDLMMEVQKSANRAFKSSSEYHLTFSLFTAGPAPSSWDIQAALNKHIQPILHALSSTTNISVASQIQLYSSFSPSVQPQQTENGWQLRKEDLTSFVNTAEWPLSPSIGTGPTINFIAYIPAQNYIPIILEDSQSNSWLVPQWGGITILNPRLIEREESELGLSDLPSYLDLEQLQPAFENFQTQLLQLLGISQSSKLPLHERLKSFQRLSGLSLYIRTSSNLGSLARLAQHLSSIPIPRHVLHSVEHALDRLEDFKLCLGKTTVSSWPTCLGSVREAFVDSEKAFFDKSMVGQVYFPDEHKVAVYLPLLGPIGVPLLVGLIRELKTITTRKKGA